ncbi:hypothetical protein [Owenweeksia hongkongensis]|uniref:hypothetical protein n=1 Tax=Owenweeksia hongkongensis TaxID=253245 RepID=UPI003A8E5944
MRNRIALICAFALIVCSCKEEKPAPPPIPDPDAPSLDLTIIKSADAALQAAYVSTISKENIVGSYTSFQGVAHARFFDSQGNKTIVKKVICEGYTLEEKGGLYKSNIENEQGIDFGSSTSWQVTGQFNVPTFNKDVASKVPEIGDINIRDSINSKDSVWLKINLQSAFTSLGNVDSINFSLAGKLNDLRYNSASTNDSVMLSPNQLKSLGTGKVYVKVEAYRIEVESMQGYNVAFINKGMFYKSLWLY